MTTQQTHAPITLYGITPYDRSGKARWLLAEMGVLHEDRWLNGKEKEYETDAYLSVNPLGRIPAMKMGDRSQFESGAICAYLADLYIDKHMAPAFNSPERLEYQQWMYFAAATLDPFMTRIMIIEDIPAGEMQTEKQEALMTEVSDAFAHLNQVLSKHDHLLASGFSAADICVSYHLYFLALWPEFSSLINANPHLARYLERLKTRAGAQKSRVFSYEA